MAAEVSIAFLNPLSALYPGCVSTPEVRIAVLPAFNSGTLLAGDS